MSQSGKSLTNPHWQMVLVDFIAQDVQVSILTTVSRLHLSSSISSSSSSSKSLGSQPTRTTSRVSNLSSMGRTCKISASSLPAFSTWPMWVFILIGKENKFLLFVNLAEKELVFFLSFVFPSHPGWQPTVHIERHWLSLRWAGITPGGPASRARQQCCWVIPRWGHQVAEAAADNRSLEDLAACPGDVGGTARGHFISFQVNCFAHPGEMGWQLLTLCFLCSDLLMQGSPHCSGSWSQPQASWSAAKERVRVCWQFYWDDFYLWRRWL